MDCEKSKQSSEKRFFLGDSDSEDSDWENEPSYLTKSGSESSDLNCMLDDDSGLGMSIGSERDSIGSNESAQIIPLRRPVDLGKSSSGHKQQRTSRNKRQFHHFYEIKNDHLGSGAYASVCTCISLDTGMEYAVKLVKKEPGHTRSRLLREVDVFKMCKGHPNIVQLVEWFEDSEQYYMVFEKMQGGPLLSQIQNKICFNEMEASQVTKEIANALKFLHSKGIAHRDLKPENVLCLSKENVSPVKLCDLDLASKPSPSYMRRTSRQLHNVQSEPDLSSPVGSAEFLAPEVVETFVGESLKYNRQCDMWSLGVICYVMLCGYVPFFGECSKADSCEWNQGQPCDECQDNLFEKIRQGSFDFPSEEWDKISDDAKDLISHLLVKDVRKRFTANDVLKHPWISSAPQTPLETSKNLFRNNSTKDIHQYNDHFNLNHFTSRLSSRVEETIPSLGSTPENEAAMQYASQDSLKQSSHQNVVAEASKLLEKQCRVAEQQPQMSPHVSFVSEPTYYSQHGSPVVSQAPGCYPPFINMNGMVICAPPMAPNSQFVHHPQQHPVPPYYNQQQQQQQQGSYYMPGEQQMNYDPNFYQHYDPTTVAQHCAREHDKTAPRPMTPSAKQLENVGIKHRESLTNAISQLGLETCVNAMVRQGSTGNEIQSSRETRVNV